MAKIGIPNYKDVVNVNTLNELKKQLNTLCIDYNKFVSNKAVENRESDLWDIYTSQYERDLALLTEMRSAAQMIADVCNKGLFNISSRAIYNHVFVDPMKEKMEEENNQEQ